MTKQKIKNQEWFNGKYSNEEAINIAETKNLKLKGSLKIQGFTMLKSINLGKFKLTDLDISHCSQLTEVKLSELSTLTSLSVTECSNLTKLDCSSTGLTKLEIFNCSRLHDIACSNSLRSLHVRGYSDLTKILETGFTSLKSLEISDCSLLNKVDLSKFPKIMSLSVFDCSKLTTFDCSSIELTSLKISDCSKLDQITGFSKLPNLKSLSVIDCLKLTSLNCSNSKKLTALEVSDLIKLDCSNTLIEELSLNLCPNIERLDCLNNKKLNKLDLSNCSKLDSLDCTGSKLTSLDLSYCPKSLIPKPPGLNITRKIEKFKNILIVGRTGGGKSTLANVLSDSNEFKESAYAVSETKHFNKKEFEWEKINFRVVDTIGTGDTKLGLKEILYKIADGIYAMPEGISQVLFVVDGRFTQNEINAFNLLRSSILGDRIFGYVTLVRTKFSQFRSKKHCDTDKDKMLKENEKIAEIVNICRDVIHVDNPPIDIEEDEDEDEDEEGDKNNLIAVNKNARDRSRIIILNYLMKVSKINNDKNGNNGNDDNGKVDKVDGNGDKVDDNDDKVDDNGDKVDDNGNKIDDNGDKVVKDDEYLKLKNWDKLRESILKYVKNDKDVQKKLKSDPELEAIYNAAMGELCLIL